MQIEIPNTRKARVVIIGGGFGGIQVAKMLQNKDVQVVIVDKNNYHTFQPLLYQVATSSLEAESIAYPIRKIFNGSKNLFFRLGEVTFVDIERKVIEFGNDSLSYDYLVIASGAKTNFYNNEGLIISAMTMKSILESLDLRTMLLQNFERALLINNERKKQGMLNVVIAGAGPTGVELAGALGELKRSVFPKDYPELDLEKMNIYLVQSGDRVLPMLSSKLSEKAKKYLERLGVTVVLNTKVLDFFGDYVQTSTGEDIIAKTLIWTAGVKGNPIKGLQEEVINKSGRIIVDEFNQVKGLKDVFAIGDVACMETEDYRTGHPQVAQVAIQQGKRLGNNLSNKICKNKQFVPFKYKHKGSMATVGKNRALVEIGNLKVGGFIAWSVWMVVHLMSLIGFRNKVVTLLNWMKKYFSSDSGMRLIINHFDLQEEKRKRRKEFESRLK
ncbi:MAG: NAD(P)/FAD-dependent oxidoreductase [Chloroflexia bacterium]|nr:NAD(P)/FAD-dependent oxidoreductase [Chloroflexia bacterium]